MSYVAFDSMVAMDNIATVTIVTCLAATVFFDESVSDRILQYAKPEYLPEVTPGFHYMDVSPGAYLTETTHLLRKKIVDPSTPEPNLTRLLLEGVEGVTDAATGDAVRIAKDCVHHFMHHTNEPFDFKVARAWTDGQDDGVLEFVRLLSAMLNSPRFVASDEGDMFDTATGEK